jgi:hypothetical protein
MRPQVKRHSRKKSNSSGHSRSHTRSHTFSDLQAQLDDPTLLPEVRHSLRPHLQQRRAAGIGELVSRFPPIARSGDQTESLAQTSLSIEDGQILIRAVFGEEAASPAAAANPEADVASDKAASTSQR